MKKNNMPRQQLVRILVWNILWGMFVVMGILSGVLRVHIIKKSANLTTGKIKMK